MLSLSVAACTSQESATTGTGVASTPAVTGVADTAVTTPAGGSDVATTPPAAPGSTDTVVNAAPATEPATVPPVTAAPAPSGVPTSTSTQFYAGGDPDGWLYLGRWTGNSWEGALDENQQPREPAIDANDVLIHELDVDTIMGTVGGSAEACPGGRSGPVISPNARAPEEPGFGYRSIAFAADWSTTPRPIALVVADVAKYTAAGVAAFDGTGIDASTGAIRQIVVTDLDGDGDSESLVAFDGSGFSALLLIDADTGTSITVSRDFIAPVAPTTTPTGSAPAAPAEPVPAPDTSAQTYRTLAVADLNGDGLMEFVVHAWEGSGAQVIVDSYDGTQVSAVLTAGC